MSMQHLYHDGKGTCRCMGGRRSSAPPSSEMLLVEQPAAPGGPAARCRKPSAVGDHADASSGSRDGRCFELLGDLHRIVVQMFDNWKRSQDHV